MGLENKRGDREDRREKMSKFFKYEKIKNLKIIIFLLKYPYLWSLMVGDMIGFPP